MIIVDVVSKTSPLHHVFVGERVRVRGHPISDPHPALSRFAGEGANR
jgi:hypothetical protein